MTHTHANLEVSGPTYEEIKAKLLEANYGHTIHDGVIDMHGIALVKRDENEIETFWVHSLVASRNQKPRVEFRIGAVRQQVETDAAMDIAHNIIECCQGSYADSFIVYFLQKKLDQPLEVAAQILQEFRAFRDELAREFKGEQK